MQLHRVFAAEHSAVVAEEDEHRRAVPPVVAEPLRIAVEVEQLDAGELVGAVGSGGLLTALRGSEHAGSLPLPLASRLEMARIAVIDLGTNSTRLLVADVEGGQVRNLERRSIVTRLGDGVDANGALKPESMERVYEIVERYHRLIDRHGAEAIEAVATSAVRDAANRDEFLLGLRERFGVEARLLSGDEEARLTFLGATSRRAGDEPTLVVDVGGGSTEFVVGIPGRDPDFHVSTQAGAVRQSERHLHGDPPSASELDELRRDVRQIIEGAVPSRVRARVTTGVAVAGTPTSLAAIDQGLEPYDPAKVDGYPLRLDAAERMFKALAGVPLAERCQVPGLHPDRAPTIVAGAAILVAAMVAFGLDRTETSEADILHGVAITMTR